jgi:hypothetical protein
MKQIVEVWCEDNYDFMKGESHSHKVSEFKSVEKAVAYMQEKLDKQMYDIAQK